jgi:16S rRNA (cytosine1402-N4)-methyltransferase
MSAPNAPLPADALSPDPRHAPVMLAEVIEALAPRPGAVMVDGTFGAGGYTRALLAAGAARVIGVDRDPTAIARGQALVADAAGRLTLAHGAFSDLEAHAEAAGAARVDGVVLDIGVSSMQLDEAERGFSFRSDGPLDMRMSLEGPSAADVVNTMEARDIARILQVYGEERQAGRIARAIVRRRESGPLTRTRDLVAAIESVLGGKRFGEAHPATRSFQAIRIHVNRELGELVDALAAAERLLPEGGRLAVVTFHSLEDRIVKRFFADRTRTTAQGSRHMPDLAVPPPTFAFTAKQPVEPSEAEAERNPRARSAKLRFAVRTAAPARTVDPHALGMPAFEPAGRRG